MFLRFIEYPSDERLYSSFTYKTCERVDKNGKRRLRAVVMDGMATGILGKLPDFKRPKIHIHDAYNTNSSQIIFDNYNARQFVSKFLKSARRSQSSAAFEVDLPGPSTCAAQAKLFFNLRGGRGDMSKRLDLSALMHAAFECDSLKGALNKKKSIKKLEKVRVKHKLKLNKLRFALVKFAKVA